MATPKRVIYNTLEKLKSDDFTAFIWHLENPTEGIEPILEAKLENANRQKVVDLMVQQYTAKAGNIAVQVLRDMKQNDLASDLEHKLQGDVPAGGGASSSGTSVTPQTTGVTMTITSSNGGNRGPNLAHIWYMRITHRPDVGRHCVAVSTASPPPPDSNIVSAQIWSTCTRCRPDLGHILLLSGPQSKRQEHELS
ncbi:hypothetical protein DPX16_23486 [Anabarilius grahami]|uniref:Pyrin domain-containing protein n=1 Tax=Anabarilius grahami TaxID=495550 RepID=A0A3N0Z1H7_ANAGA|nr:hypothetical protein DPX16_23486 [Anabarilius grahami]